MVVVALFMTGLAQRQIIPLVQERAARAMERAKSAVTPGDKGPAGGVAGESGMPGATSGEGAGAAVAGAAGSVAAAGDSMLALSEQIETEKSFLAQRQEELQRMRAGIDSLQQKAAVVDDAELKRQAKLFAAMKADEAAPVLAQMDDATLAMLLGAMNPKAAAKVMARLDATRIARLASQAVHRGDLTGVVTSAGQEVESATQ